MKTSKGIAIIAMVASLILVTGTAAAQADPTGATVDNDADQGQFSNTGSAGTADIDGGNVTNANISTEQTTGNWAGLFGNATGTLVLGDGTDRLYEWDAVAEYVFASENTVNFGTLAGDTASNLASSLSYGDVSDNATQTFDDGNTTLNDIAGSTVEGSTALTYDGASPTPNEVWETVYLTDGSDNDIFAGVAQPYGSETSYAGTDADYQMILPAENTGTATGFNLYMELQ